MFCREGGFEMWISFLRNAFLLMRLKKKCKTSHTCPQLGCTYTPCVVYAHCMHGGACCTYTPRMAYVQRGVFSFVEWKKRQHTRRSSSYLQRHRSVSSISCLSYTIEGKHRQRNAFDPCRCFYLCSPFVCSSSSSCVAVYLLHAWCVG